MSLSKVQTIDDKIEAVHSNLMGWTIITALCVFGLMFTAIFVNRTGLNPIITFVITFQIAWVALSLPVMIWLGLKYVELSFLKLDRR